MATATRRLIGLLIALSVGLGTGAAAAVADTTPPAAPTGLTGAPGDRNVTLDWADNQEPDLNGYDVYRDGNWHAYSEQSQFTDSGLVNGRTYSYSVLAYDDSVNVSPLSTPVTTCPGFGTYGVAGWPPGCWRPYSASSPFNRAIPSNPQLHPASAQIVSRITGWGPPSKLAANYHDTSQDWSAPTYFSKAADPLFTLDCTGAAGYCEPGIDGIQIRIPDAAKPAGGGDRHITVVDQATRTEYDFWNVTSKPAGGGTLMFAGGGKARSTATDATREPRPPASAGSPGSSEPRSSPPAVSIMRSTWLRGATAVSSCTPRSAGDAPARRSANRT